MSFKHTKPKRVVVENDQATIQGKLYRATVLVVTEKDSDGTARAFRLLRDDEAIKVHDGMAFEIVFARADLQKRRH